MKPLELVGRRFHRWQVIARGENSDGGMSRWICRCDCGSEGLVLGYELTRGRSRSCGCLRVETFGVPGQNKTHGLTGSATYRSWFQMWQRCRNTHSKDFARYGARGITVCERWESFSNFVADMGNRPDGTTLDRWPNQRGNYEPGNCRWATNIEQAQNRRSNVLLTHDGETHCISEWARRIGMKKVTLEHRVRSGWSAKEALTIPVDPKKRTRWKR